MAWRRVAANGRNVTAVTMLRSVPPLQCGLGTCGADQRAMVAAANDAPGQVPGGLDGAPGARAGATGDGWQAGDLDPRSVGGRGAGNQRTCVAVARATG